MRRGRWGAGDLRCGESGRCLIVAGIVSAFAPLGCGRTGFKEQPALFVNRTEIVFTARAGELVSPARLNLTNPWGDPIEWSARASETWLRVSPAAGITPSTVSVGVSTTGLMPGEYLASVSFAAPALDDDPTALLPVVWVRFSLTAPGWETGRGPWGGQVFSVASDGAVDGRALAGDGKGRIWLSDDGGQSFRRGQELVGEIRDITLDAPTGIAYAGSASNGLWTSLDSGNTWQATSYIGAALQIAVEPDHPSVVYVRGAGGVARSLDGGDSWTNVINSVACVATGPANPDDVFTCGNSRNYFHSVDRGEIWTEHGVANSDPLWVYRDPAAPQTLIIGNRTTALVNVSTDDGVTWTSIGQGVPAGHGRMIGRVGDDLIMAHSQGMLWSTNGDVWTGIPIEVTQTSRSYHRFAAAGDTVLATNEILGLLIGEGPLRPAPGILTFTIQDLSVHPLTGDVVITSTNLGLWRLDRQTETWTSLAESFLYDGDWNEWVRRLVRDPVDPDRLLLALCYGGIRESLDGGDTWGATGAGGGDCVNDIAWAPDDTSLVYSASGGSVYISRDRGTSFDPLGSMDRSVTRLAPLAGEFVVFSDDIGDLVRSTADGDAEPVGYVDDIHEVAVDDNSGVWLASDGGIYYLTAGEMAPTKVAGACGATVKGIAVDGDDVWITCAGIGMQHTNDAGATWEDVGCPSSEVGAIESDPVDGSLWVVTQDLGMLRFTP